MFLFPAFAALCALVCILVHYEFLRLLSCSAQKLSIAPRQRILYVVAGALGSHVVQIVLFAFTLWALSYLSELQAIDAGANSSFAQALYVSFESYAALGSSESLSYGPLRLFAGFEGLSGLVLIGWTSAFTYWCMTKFWDEHPLRPKRKPEDRRRPRREPPSLNEPKTEKTEPHAIATREAIRE